MDVPNIVYYIAFVLSGIAIVLEVVSCLASLHYELNSNYDAAITPVSDIFKSGMKIRNSSFCFLVLLFFIANKKTVFKGVNALLAISKICRFFATGSIVVFALGIIISLVGAVKKIKIEHLKKYNNMIFRSSLISILIGFCLAYFFYIP